MIAALAFAKTYWKQLAGIAAVVALVLLGLHWLHGRDAQHYAAGQADVQRKWNDDKLARDQAAIRALEQEREISRQRVADAMKGRDDAIAQKNAAEAVLVARNGTIVGLRARADRLAASLGAMSGTGPGPGDGDGARTLAELLGDGLGLVAEGERRLAICAAEVTERDAVIAADRAGQAVTH